jgi:hypothetical protein
LERWPAIDDQDPESIAHCAIHCSLGDLIGLRGISKEDCQTQIGTSLDELFATFKRWKKDFDPQSPLDFLI